MATQRPRGFVFIMIHHWLITLILAAVGAGLVIGNDALPIFVNLLALGMFGVAAWCCQCGYRLHARHPSALRGAKITHAFIAILVGLFSVLCIGTATFTLTDAFFHPNEYWGWAGMAVIGAAGIGVVGAAALPFAFISRWVARRLGAASASEVRE